MNDETTSRRTVTIKDVAELANVHHTTASRALRGNPEIHAETVLRVRAAALQLGYQPNLHARALRAPQTSALVGLVTDPKSVGQLSLYSAFWVALMNGLTAGLADAGFGLIQVTADASGALENLPLRALMVLSLLDAPAELPAALQHVPLLVTRDHSLSPQALATLGHDHAAIAHEACAYMFARGSRRIAYLPLSSRDQVSVAASIGYRSWCARENQEPLIIEPAADPGTQTTNIKKALANEIDGIFATTGETASVLAAIAGNALTCPSDVQFICVGEGIVERLVRPQLSSMNLQGESAGADIARTLVRAANGEKVEDVVCKHHLVARETTRS